MGDISSRLEERLIATIELILIDIHSNVKDITELYDLKFGASSLHFILMTTSEEQAAHVLITGAAGQIGYIMAFSVARGELLGQRKVVLHLLEIPSAMKKLEGTVMELIDSAFPLVQEIIWTDKPEVAFKDVDYAFLIASVPLKQGQIRKDMLEANAPIFKAQGEALSKYSKKTVKVLVVGNPCNTNCLVAMQSAKNLKPSNFSCMCRLDQNRSIAELAHMLNVPVTKIHKVVVWGNHAETQVPDASNAVYETEEGLKKVTDKIEVNYLENEFAQKIAHRAWDVLDHHGNTSAESACEAAIDHMKDWIFGTDEITCMGISVPENRPYGINTGIYFSFPCKVDHEGNVHVVENLEVNDWLREKLKITEKDLFEERKTAWKTLGIKD